MWPGGPCRALLPAGSPGCPARPLCPAAPAIPRLPELLLGHSSAPGTLRQRAQGPALPGALLFLPGGSREAPGAGARCPSRSCCGSAGPASPGSPRGRCEHPPGAAGPVPVPASPGSPAGSVRTSPGSPRGLCEHPPGAGTTRDPPRELLAGSRGSAFHQRSCLECRALGHRSGPGSPPRPPCGNTDRSRAGSAGRRSPDRREGEREGWRERGRELKSRWGKFWRRDTGETGRQNHLRSEQAGNF